MFVAFLLSPLFLVQVTCSEAKVSPRDLAVFLKSVGIPFDKFLQSALHRKYTLTSSPQYAKRFQLQNDTNDTPLHSQGVITTTKEGAPYKLLQAKCEPRAIPVKIPKSPGTTIFPDYVMLDRCVGGCPYTQDITHCAVTHQDKINVLVSKVTPLWTKLEPVVMYRHTGCACDCIEKPSACDYAKQWWDVSSCSCKCIAQNSHHCSSVKQTWKEHECECRCTHVPTHCPVKKEWDFINCGCRCSASLASNCKANNKLINSVTCECEEPDIDVLS
ncbi:uncharacterized protein [Montipora capricornis]|uniref:uncharacterized protein isoform X1 n=1 Tax=Montipora capricornis TaxID=246305 RepID=UPI0035F1D8CE